MEFPQKKKEGKMREKTGVAFIMFDVSKKDEETRI